MISLILFCFGFSTVVGIPAQFESTSTIMVNYDDGQDDTTTTTEPPFVNYANRGPSPSAIYLRTDSETEAVMRKLEWTKLPSMDLVLDRDDSDNSTIHVETSDNAEGEDRIINGETVAAGELPMKARLSLNFGTTASHCGGTILCDKWILTAAHCVSSRERTLQSVFIRVGSIFANSGGQTQTIMASMAIPHENYMPEPGSVPSGYDIALLRLATPLTFNDFIQWAYVSALPNPAVGSTLTAAGWGVTDNNMLSEVLKRSDNFGLNNFPAASGSLVCTFTGNGHTCGGDSGGFVGHQHSSGRFIVDAVVSFGPTGCPTGTSGHTSVGFFLQWLLDTANSN